MAMLQMLVVAALAVIALLLGILVGYANVLTGRARHANATLRRIEEILISRAGILASTSTQAAASAQAAATARAPEAPASEGEAPRYRTLRDLKNGPAGNGIIAAHLERISPGPAAEPAAAPPAGRDSEDKDSADRKERDALLIMLNNQRRRRRARQGY